MSKIKVMDEALANKIAAGEVVERPLSIVKELIENSIDANSTVINIDLLDAGIKQIQVIDNGLGIEKLDLPLALKRHATSKISTDLDLFNLDTLGFRGEALASIAAVSKIKIISNIDGISTWQFDNIDQEFLEVAGNKGTRIIIDELFYNTPVRFKHLSSTNYELSLILNYVKQISLLYPGIKFSLTNNKKMLYQTDGQNNINNILNNIYGHTTAKEFKEVIIDDKDIEGSIWLCHPIITKPNKKDLIISINHRLVKNKKIEDAIIDGYKGYLHTNQYPLCYININLDPSLIDANIHPTKQQVKIGFLDKICNIITELIANQLKVLNFIPEFSLNQEIIETTSADESIKVNNVKFNQPQTTFDFTQTKVEDNEEWKLPIFRYIGSLYQTYLLFENEEGLYFVDQHAAQERINYEKFLKMFEEKQFIYQQLLIPITIHLSSEEGIIFNNLYQNLENFGLQVEQKSINVYQITAVDQFYTEAKNLSNDILQMIRLIIKNNNVKFVDLYEDVAIMMACKSSIKAHHYLDNTAINDLLRQLNKCNNPFTCPHGRPIINKITKYEIEKLFKR